MLQHRATEVQPSNRRWFVSSRRESDVTGYRSDHWRRVWERGQIVADVTLFLVFGEIESLILWRQISMIGCIQHDGGPLNLGTFRFSMFASRALVSAACPSAITEHRCQDVHHPHLQLCSAVFCRGHGVDGDPRNLGIGVVRWFVSSRRPSHGSSE